MNFSTQTLGLIIGGLVPALMFTLANISAKLSTQAGIDTGRYMTIIGLTITAVGLGLYYFLPERELSSRSAMFAAGVGVTWAIGSACIAIALMHYQAPMAKISPIFNTNTLFTVALALWIFSEWKETDVTKLLLGTFFIVVGGVLVARS